MGLLGESEEWRSITKSKNHKAIPLTDQQAIQNLPMVFALFNQIGFKTFQAQNSGSLVFLRKEDHDFRLFLVAKADGNPLISRPKRFCNSLWNQVCFWVWRNVFNWKCICGNYFSKKEITVERAEMFHSLVPVFKFSQVENELKGRIFSGIKNSSGKFSEKIKLAVEKEKAYALNEELVRTNKALLK